MGEITYNDTIRLRICEKIVDIPVTVTHKDLDVDADILVRIEYEGNEYIGRGDCLEWTDAFADLQKQLPDGVLISSCLTCRHGTLCPYGNIPNYVLCFRSEEIKSKDDVIDRLYGAETGHIERTAFQCCEDFEPAKKGYYTYNDFLYFLEK